MKLDWFLILFPFIVLIISSANAACSSDTCPIGGLWSVWETTDDCKTKCGACNSATYTRTCLSTSMNGGCACIGNTTITMPCGTQACNYPRYNGSGVICCVGSPMIINNWFQCGPLKTNSTLACCPTGGYWSAWGIWVKQANVVKWSRTRTCLSGELACPCTGEAIQSKYGCPCPAISTITTCDSTNKTPFTVRTPYYSSSDCTATIVFEATNFRKEFFFTNGTKDWSTLGWIDSTGKCNVQDASGFGSATSKAGSFYKFSLLCNTTTGRFYGRFKEANFVDVVSIGQFY